MMKHLQECTDCGPSTSGRAANFCCVDLHHLCAQGSIEIKMPRPTHIYVPQIALTIRLEIHEHYKSVTIHSSLLPVYPTCPCRQTLFPFQQSPCVLCPMIEIHQ